MATQLPDIPEQGFQSRYDFSDWLIKLDEKTMRTFAPVLAARAALRASVFVVEDANRTKSFFDLTMTVFRAHAIARVVLEYPTRAIEGAAAASFAADAASFATAASFAARSAASAASAARSAATAASFAAADATTAAAARSADAFDAFATADATTAAASAVWAALTDDARALVLGLESVRLNDRPLWPNGTPDWWQAIFDKLKAALAAQSSSEEARTGWLVWMDWLQCRVDGSRSWNLPADASREIQERIALGDGREAFWKREPEEINGEIAGWLRELGWRQKEPEFDFFLSFNKEDITEAKFISDTLEGNGYSVFSQFNDFRAGNFIDHMNTGLKGMARFLAVYSPSYFKSDACTGEYQAALTIDPSGNSGKFIPFMVRVSSPPPLLYGIIYHPLFNLPADAKSKAILDAITKPVSPSDRAAQRLAARNAVSPDVVIDPAGRRIDSGKNAVFDEVYADEDLFDLPERMRQIVDQLSKLLQGKNNCYSIQMCLDAIDGELSARGLDCSIGLLADQMELIDIDLENGDASLLASNNDTGRRFKKLSELFATMRSHFPLDQKRESIFRQAQVEIKTPEQMADLHRQISDAVQDAANEDLVTDHYKQVIENRIRVTKDILSIPNPIVPKSDDLDFVAREEDRLVRVQTAKRRALAQDAAVADKTIEVAASLATIADSTAGKALIEVMKRLGNWIWGG